MKRSILVICVHNSARSQMADEYLKKFGGDLFDVESAGLDPGKLNPFVVKALAEEGIDISGKLTRDAFELKKQGRTFSYVITVCSKEAEERCPIYPNTLQRFWWPFDDPSAIEGDEETVMARVREIRDGIKEKVSAFVYEYRKNEKK